MNQNPKSYSLANGYDDWLADVYDHWYFPLLQEQNGPYRPIRILMDDFPELSGRSPSQIAILDCACGTGNSYVAFKNHDYDIWASDGSRAMLRKAVEKCGSKGLSADQLVQEPVCWTDGDAYRRHFTDRGVQFDVVMLPSNSFCHIPQTSGY